MVKKKAYNVITGNELDMLQRVYLELGFKKHIFEWFLGPIFIKKGGHLLFFFLGLTEIVTKLLLFFLKKAYFDTIYFF